MKDQGFSYCIRRKVYATYCRFAKLVWKNAHRNNPDQMWDKGDYRKHKAAFVLSAIKQDLYGKMFSSKDAEKAKQIASIMHFHGHNHGDNLFNHGSSSSEPKRKKAHKNLARSITKVANQDVAQAVQADTGIPKGVTEGAEKEAEHMMKVIL